MLRGAVFAPVYRGLGKLRLGVPAAGHTRVSPEGHTMLAGIQILGAAIFGVPLVWLREAECGQRRDNDSSRQSGHGSSAPGQLLGFALKTRVLVFGLCLCFFGFFLVVS